MPVGWRVTPRKAEEPREKPWLCLRTVMMSSSRLMLSMTSIRSRYLPCMQQCAQSVISDQLQQQLWMEVVRRLKRTASST